MTQLETDGKNIDMNEYHEYGLTENLMQVLGRETAAIQNIPQNLTEKGRWLLKLNIRVGDDEFVEPSVFLDNGRIVDMTGIKVADGRDLRNCSPEEQVAITKTLNLGNVFTVLREPQQSYFLAKAVKSGTPQMEIRMGEVWHLNEQGVAVNVLYTRSILR